MSFKKRIATYFMLATAIIILCVFGTVYFIVQETVYANLDNDLSFEANKHKSEIDITGETIHFINKGEWEEHEHKQVQVNPVFLQILNAEGEVMDKSPNLKEDEMSFQTENTFGNHFNAKLREVNVRQVQIPMYYKEELKGFIVAAMSLEASLMVLENLRMTLFILFPIVLIGLFIISSFLAGRSIIPVVQIIETTNRITKYNLKERVPLPSNTDELYDLADSINSLLSRIESALERERQFTSDASHELRTPLAALRGTLEVLVRKPRTEKEYREKIGLGLVEIDRMAAIIDQLLALARFDNDARLEGDLTVSIKVLVDSIIERHKSSINEKNVSIQVVAEDCPDAWLVHQFHADLLLDNLVSNAIKYTKNDDVIAILLREENQQLYCEIKDQGIGIAQEDLTKIFQPFFRSGALNHPSIKGIGLGLSLVEKAANAIDARLSFESELGKGTKVVVFFKEILR